MANLLLIIAILLDGIISLFISSDSYLIPLITITTIYMIYPLYKKKGKKYEVATIISGLIYDVMYTNLLFFNTIMFYCVGKFVKYLHKNFNQNLIKCIIYVILTIIYHELLTVMILIIFKIIPVNANEVIYKITHSMLTNLIYATILYYVLQKRKQKI